MKDINVEDCGIDTSQITICKKIRNIAKLSRIRLDETEQISRLNKHLFDYIKYCGLDVLQFITQYLRNLQPYMVERGEKIRKQKVLLYVS